MSEAVAAAILESRGLNSDSSRCSGAAGHQSQRL